MNERIELDAVLMPAATEELCPALEEGALLERYSVQDLMRMGAVGHQLSTMDLPVATLRRTAVEDRDGDYI